jgi:hypothetical protein
MAVEASNGKDIANLYKLKTTSLSKLTKSANDNKSTGRKKRGHAANTIHPPDNHVEILAAAIAPTTRSISVQKKPAYTKAATKRALQELVTVTKVDSVIKSGVLITEDLIATEPENLSDMFIDNSIDLQSLQCYFDADAWAAVESLVRAKVRCSTCILCSKFCLSECIQCTSCHKWFHFSCEGVDPSSADTNLTSQWKCLVCTSS